MGKKPEEQHVMVWPGKKRKKGGGKGGGGKREVRGLL